MYSMGLCAYFLLLFCFKGRVGKVVPGSGVSAGFWFRRNREYWKDRWSGVHG